MTTTQSISIRLHHYSLRLTSKVIVIVKPSCSCTEQSDGWREATWRKPSPASNLFTLQSTASEDMGVKGTSSPASPCCLEGCLRKLVRACRACQTLSIPCHSISYSADKLPRDRITHSVLSSRCHLPRTPTHPLFLTDLGKALPISPHHRLYIFCTISCRRLNERLSLRGSWRFLLLRYSRISAAVMFSFSPNLSPSAAVEPDSADLADSTVPVEPADGAGDGWVRSEPDSTCDRREHSQRGGHTRPIRYDRKVANSCMVDRLSQGHQTVPIQ